MKEARRRIAQGEKFVRSKMAKENPGVVRKNSIVEWEAAAKDKD